MRQEDLVISACMAINPSMSLDEIRTHANTLRPHVHAVQLGDNWHSAGHMDGVVVASILRQDELDTVVHLSGRDRNRIALQSSLLAAAATGITSLLLSRGEKLPERLRGKVKGVFDTRGSQLYDLARKVGSNAGVPGDAGFYVGTYAPVINPPEDWEGKQIREKVDAGVNFLQTRPCLNVEMLRCYMRAMVARKITHRAPLIVEIPVISSAESAETIRKICPGTRIPARIIKQIDAASDPVAAGIDASAAMIRETVRIPGVSGVNIVYESDPATVVAALEAAGVGN